jgi:hypothetical protein
MQDKQKVTLYLSQELHRQLKIKAAVDAEPMSQIAERALVFYLAHPHVVEELENSYGRSHRVYTCPECTSSVTMREGDLVSLRQQPSVLNDEGISVETVVPVGEETDRPGEEELVPCL